MSGLQAWDGSSFLGWSVALREAEEGLPPTRLRLFRVLYPWSPSHLWDEGSLSSAQATRNSSSLKHHSIVEKSQTLESERHDFKSWLYSLSKSCNQNTL